MKIRLLMNVVVSAVLILATAEYDGGRPGIVETLEKQSYDWRLTRGIDKAKKRDDIVIIDIDNDSFRELGRWPWSRDVYADLTERLFETYQARIVAFSLPFPEPNDADLRILDRIGRELSDDRQSSAFGVNTDINSRLRRLREDFDYDSRFAAALRGRAVVLGYQFAPSGRAQGTLPPLTRFDEVGGGAPLASAVLNSMSRDWEFRRGFVGNMQLFLTAVNGAAGHTEITADDDGVVRRLPLFVKHAGGYYPSLPVAILRKLHQHKTGDPVLAEVESPWSLFGVRYSVPSFEIGNYMPPLNPDGTAYVRYLGAGGRNVDFRSEPNAVFRYIPVSEIIAERTPRKDLSGKIVMVGSSSAIVRDIHATPVNSTMPGAELAATFLANMLDGSLLHRGAGAQFYETLILIGVLSVLSALFVFLGPLLSFGVLVAVIGGHVFFVLREWDANNAVWVFTPLLLSAFGLYMFNVVVGFIVEWRASRHLQNTFSQYVPPEFAKRMGQSGEKVNLEGEQRELTVLFSDVRNFTAISENLSPQELTLLMNRMLTALSEAIHRHSGTVDKYIGDAVMAFWNAPLADEKHAQNAVLAAMDMQQTMLKLSDELVAEGHPEMRLGVGLSTGETNVGNMGSALRMAYTAMGDTVNLASRVEGLTKHYRAAIIITEYTRAQCDNSILFRVVDNVRVKGREKPVRLYEPLGPAHLMEPATLDQVAKFEEFWEKYAAGDFPAAAPALADYVAAFPDDRLAEVYVERMKSLADKPTPPDWDGVFSHEVK